MNIEFDKSNIPGWYKKAFLLSLLPFLAWPILFVFSAFLFDAPSEYIAQLGAKVSIVLFYPVYILIANLVVYMLLGIRVNKYVALLGYLLPVVFIFAGFKYIDNAPLPKSWLTREDSRLFYDTPANDLANAIVDDDSVEIANILNDSPDLANYTEDLVNYHGDSYKENMLFFAFYNKKFRPMRILISKGANPNCYDVDNVYTLLHQLCWGDSPSTDGDSEEQYMPKEYLNIIKLLLSKGAKVDIVTKKYVDEDPKEYEGMTPLQELCLNGPDSPETAKLLLDHGADINRKWTCHHDNLTEIHTLFYDACESRHYRLAEYLLTRGAKKDSVSIENLKYEKQGLEASVKVNPRQSVYAKTDKATLKIVNRILEYK